MSSSALKTNILSQIRSSYGQGGAPFQVKTPTASVPTNPTPRSAVLTVGQQLDTLEQVLNEMAPQISATTPPVVPFTPDAIEAQDVVPAAMPMAVISATDTLNPPTAGSVTTAKEALQSAPPEKIQVDVTSGLQTVEVEPPANELPVEVEGFLQEVRQNQEQLPQEIVITGDTAQLLSAKPPLRPVIVLPITQDMEQSGQHKGTQWSIRWLVEWSRRLMKMFKGEVVYAEEPKP